MVREVMRRRASDNEYFHPDFHGALSAAIEYLDLRYGEQAVRDYLRRFTTCYYSPLRSALQKSGLAALKEHFEGLYQREGGKIDVTLSENELLITVRACPAVTHMRKRGYHVARLFHETTKTVNEALCEGTAFSAQLVQYDPQTGRSVVRFWRRRP